MNSFFTECKSLSKFELEYNSKNRNKSVTGLIKSDSLPLKQIAKISRNPKETIKSYRIRSYINPNRDRLPQTLIAKIRLSAKY